MELDRISGCVLLPQGYLQQVMTVQLGLELAMFWYAAQYLSGSW